MSFRMFVYYCAIGSGWAAFLAWGLTTILPFEGHWLRPLSITGLLGLLVAGAIGFVDARAHAPRHQRPARIMMSLGVGLCGGIMGGGLGQLLQDSADQVGGFFGTLMRQRLLGWIVIALAIGMAPSLFDLLNSRDGEQIPGAARRKIVNGLVGGFVGGLIGGLVFEALLSWLPLSHASLALGLVSLGLCIGLFIGLIHVVRMKAWVGVEQGFRPGRAWMLHRAETIVGRSESCDIGLVGDPAIEPVHARIIARGHSFLVVDNQTASGTFLNDQQISDDAELRSGDRIRMGNSVLRFSERSAADAGRDGEMP